MKSLSISLLIFFALGLNAQQNIQHPNTANIELAKPFVDNRDGEIYQTVRVGNQRWFSENLRYNVPNVFTTQESIDTMLSPNDLKHYGRLYDWATLINQHKDFNKDQFHTKKLTIQGICPKGWHISTDEDWKALEQALGMDKNDLETIARDRLVDDFDRVLSSNDWISSDDKPNNSLLNIFPTGHYQAQKSERANIGFYRLGEVATFWTTTEMSGDRVLGRSIIYNSPAVSRYDKYKKNRGYACRCVEN